MKIKSLGLLSLAMLFSGGLLAGLFDDFKASLEAEVARQCPGSVVDVRHLDGPYFGGAKSMTQTFAHDGNRKKPYPVYVVAGDVVGALKGVLSYFVSSKDVPYATLNQPGWRSVVFLLDSVTDHDRRLRRIHRKCAEKSQSVHVLNNAPDQIAALVGKIKQSILGYEKTKKSYYDEKKRQQAGGLVVEALDLGLVGAAAVFAQAKAPTVSPHHRPVKPDFKKRSRDFPEADDAGVATTDDGLPTSALLAAVAKHDYVPEKFRIHFDSITSGLRSEGVSCNATFCAGMASAAGSGGFSSVDLGGSSGGAGGLKSLSIVYMSLQDLLAEGSLEHIGIKKHEARPSLVRVFYTDERREERSVDSPKEVKALLQRISDEYQLSTSHMDSPFITEVQLAAIKNKWSGLASPQGTRSPQFKAVACAVAAAVHAPASSPVIIGGVGVFPQAGCLSSAGHVGAPHGDGESVISPSKRRCVFDDCKKSDFDKQLDDILRDFSGQGLFSFYQINNEADFAPVADGKKIVLLNVSALFSGGKTIDDVLVNILDHDGRLLAKFGSVDCLVIIRNDSPEMFAKATLVNMWLKRAGVRVYFPLLTLSTEVALAPIMQAIQEFMSR